MMRLNVKNSWWYTMHSVGKVAAATSMLVGILGSSAARADEPLDAQSQARTVLVGRSTHQIATRTTFAPTAYSDAQAQARRVVLGAPVAALAPVDAPVGDAVRGDAQQQARDLLSARAGSDAPAMPRLMHAHR